MDLVIRTNCVRHTHTRMPTSTRPCGRHTHVRVYDTSNYYDPRYALDGPTCYVESTCPLARTAQRLNNLYMAPACMRDQVLLVSRRVSSNGKYRATLRQLEPGV